MEGTNFAATRRAEKGVERRSSESTGSEAKASSNPTELAIRERYRRQRTAYGFDRLASRVVREARAAAGIRGEIARGAGTGAVLAILALVLMSVFGILGPKPEAPVRLWVNSQASGIGHQASDKTHGRAATPGGGASTVAPNHTENPRCRGTQSAQGALASAALHEDIARPQYLGGEPADRFPQTNRATRPADVHSSHPPGARALSSCSAVASGEYSK
jgi:hypothetical protein